MIGAYICVVLISVVYSLAINRIENKIAKLEKLSKEFQEKLNSYSTKNDQNEFDNNEMLNFIVEKFRSKFGFMIIHLEKYYDIDDHNKITFKQSKSDPYIVTMHCYYYQLTFKFNPEDYSFTLLKEDIVVPD